MSLLPQHRGVFDWSPFNSLLHQSPVLDTNNRIDNKVVTAVTTQTECGTCRITTFFLSSKAGYNIVHRHCSIRRWVCAAFFLTTRENFQIRVKGMNPAHSSPLKTQLSTSVTSFRFVPSNKKAGRTQSKIVSLKSPKERRAIFRDFLFLLAIKETFWCVFEGRGTFIQPLLPWLQRCQPLWSLVCR